MDKNQWIIVGLVIVIIALIIGLAVMMQAPTKENVKLTIKNKKVIEEGENVKIQLTDMNGTPIKDQTVNISVTDKDGWKIHCQLHIWWKRELYGKHYKSNTKNKRKTC